MEIDVRNLPCPQPVVKTIKGLKELKDGEKLHVLTDSDASLANIKRTAEGKHCTVEVEEKDGFWEMILTPSASTDVSDVKESDISCSLPQNNEFLARPMVVAVGSNLMGCGDSELGKILMKSYLYALTQMEDEDLPDTILFYNAGAKLTVEGSESLEDIKTLEKRGVEIFTCGTCLDFFKIKDKLAVGGVSNMYHIANTMLIAGRTIRI